MGVREKLNQRPLLVAGAVGVALAASLGFYLMNSSGESANGGKQTAFFSIDDGKTWFAGDGDKLSPIMKDGKPAYRVSVWTCDGGKTKFVSHLERYTDEAKSKLEQFRANRQQVDPGELRVIMTNGMEVKAPGAPMWVNRSTAEGTKIAIPRCPDGSTKNLEPVSPG